MKLCNWCIGYIIVVGSGSDGRPRARTRAAVHCAAPQHVPGEGMQATGGAGGSARPPRPQGPLDQVSAYCSTTADRPSQQLLITWVWLQYPRILLDKSLFQL